MATKQQSKKRPNGSRASSSGRAKPAARSSSRTGSSRSSSGSRTSRPRAAAPPSFGSRLLDSLSLVLDGRGHDVWGVALFAIAVVAAFGIYGHSAGPVGTGLAAVIGAVFGLTKVLVPPALVAISYHLIRGPRYIDIDEETGEVLPSALPRRIVGGVVVLASITGLLHLVVDPPTIAASGLDAFAGAGGLIGGGVGGGLSGLLGAWGTAAVLVLLLLLGGTLVAAIPFRELGPLLRSITSPAVDGGGRSLSKLFRIGDDAAADDGVQLFDYNADPSDPLAKKSRAPRKKPAKPDEPTIVLPEVSVPTSVEQLEIQLDPQRPGSPWKLPQLSLLTRSKAQQHDTNAITARGRDLEAALAEHGVTTRLSGMVVGPTVTRYELELGVGIKVNQVVNLSKDIAYAMASPDVRIIAPIPGKQAIGVEVPNQKRQLVALGDILCSPEAQKAKGPLSVAVGRDIEGKSVMVDLAKMPHILIAGQTGAGKSSCINSIMTSVLMRATPDDVRLILIDPKRVELTQYNRVPHLLTQVVTNPKKAANALAWAVAEMERRYELLEEVGCRDLGGYNAAFDRGELAARLGEEREFTRLPLIMIVVDELADLMMVAARDVEESINRIAAKARAVGLHLVIATQRPSVNVITGVIKANIPARFAFSVASATDSKVIMNVGGAERLVGKGDMLFLDPAAPSAERIQGCFVDEKEVHAVVSTWRGQTHGDVQMVDEVVGDANIAAVSLPGSSGGGDEDDDDLMVQAMELVVRSQLGSTSMLQRKLKVGFARAGRIMDLLEENGVVGPSQGSKSREVLMTVEELENALANR